MGNRDPLWVVFPRWIEESGLPEEVAKECGGEGWLLFRKLIELDCDANLTPDWFSIRIDDLFRWTGIERQKIESLLSQLQNSGWIDRTNTCFDDQTCRIVTPLSAPLEEAKIRTALSANSSAGNFILRYYQNTRTMNAVENVIYFYQMLFGARFSPRIAEDLEEIANTYDMGVIYDIFSEAYSRKVKSLAWVKSHLEKAMKKETEHEKSTKE